MKRLILPCLVFVSLVPHAASAVTAQELLAQIDALTAQLQTFMASGGGSAATLSGSQSCPSLTRTLSPGSRGTDVTALQNFLISQKLLSADSNTGYFGVLTEGAVKGFQCNRSIICSGTASDTGWGIAGPKTRAKVGEVCSVSAAPAIVTVNNSGVTSSSSCTFNGQPVQNGQSVSAFQSAAAQACIVEQRTCINGTLTGSYQYPTCSFLTQVSFSTSASTSAAQMSSTTSATSSAQFICLLNGQKTGGFSNGFTGQQCDAGKRICTGGTLTGNNPITCSMEYSPQGGNSSSATSSSQFICLANGTKVNAFRTATGQECDANQRICIGGTRTGSNPTRCSVTYPAQGGNSSSSNNTAQSCSFNGKTIANGERVTAFKYSTATGLECVVAENRTCNNGTLSGIYQYESCTSANASGTTASQGSETIDTLSYFVTQHPGQALSADSVTHFNQAVFSSERILYLMKWGPKSFIVYKWDDAYIYFLQEHEMDFAGAPATALNYSFSPGYWMKRYMKIGESLDGTAQGSIQTMIKYYDTPHTCNIKSTNRYYMKTVLEARIPDYDLGGHLGKQDVIVLRVEQVAPGTAGYSEKEYYAKGWGLVKWQECTRDGSSCSKSVVLSELYRHSAWQVDRSAACPLQYVT